jgi:hypothetical protein
LFCGIVCQIDLSGGIGKMGKKRITAMLTLVLGLLLLKVTAGYAAPCTSALANIDPTSVSINAQDQAFSYYIEPTINLVDSGINKIDIVVPDSYSNVHVTSVSIGNTSPGYNDNSSGNTISVTLHAKVTVDGTDIRVNFTAHTPNSPDSGVAFLSTVDDTESSDSVNCTDGSWTVTASYAGSCTSAVAEIDPTSVNVNTDDQAFSYYIEPTISAGDSGIDKINIVVPSSYSDMQVTSVSVGGSQAGYNNNSSRNTISVTLDTKVTVNGTDLQVNFTADTPNSADSGVAFLSTVDDTENSAPVNCTDGSWTVTASYAGSCTSAVAEISPTSVNINTDDQTFSYYIEPTINPDDSGIDKIVIEVPAAYSNVKVMDVLVAGVRVSHSDNTSSNTISLTLGDKVTIDGTNLQVNFTAHTPDAVDSGTAFRSTVDDTSYPSSVSCTPGDGDDGGSIATDTWTVTAGYAGPCASAVAEIDPTDVNINTDDQAFSYYIEPTINPDDSGINKIDIVVPGSYSHVRVTSVLVGGSPAGYDDSDTSVNIISVTLDTKVTVDGTNLQVNFTANTPNSPDSGVEFPSAVNDTENFAPVNCSSGDGDGGGSVSSNTWTVTAGYAGPCTSAVAEIDPTDVNINTDDQAFFYYIEPTISTDDSGINKIEIVVPGSYSDVRVTSVLVGGDTLSDYDNNSSGNTISVTLDTKVTVDGTGLQVNFTADTPNSPDSGVAFPSTVDDTENSEPVSCQSGDGDSGGDIATNTWTVTAGYAGPCTSAVAEINPTYVNINTDDQAFSYYIRPTINPDDSGVDKIEITVPDTYSDVKVTGVSVGGDTSSEYDNNSSGNTISVTLRIKVTKNGTELRVSFTADTPGAVDSGVEFKSTVDNTSNFDPVACRSGDGEGSVSTDTWIVTAPLSDGGNACFIATAASGFTMELRLKVFGEFRDRILLSNKAARSLVELYYYTCFSYCGRLHNGT